MEAGDRPGERETRMRWYNPRTRGFEWRSVPGSDEEALVLLESSPGEQTVAGRTYREWRWLGASIMAALIRAGEAVQEEKERRPVDSGRRRDREAT